MSSRRHSRSRRPSQTGRLSQNHNITVVKLIDPLVQSLLMIFFLYCVDDERVFPYRTVFFALIFWQYASVFFNFFLRELKLLKNERTIFVVTMSLYMIFFVLFERHVHEHTVAMDVGMKSTFPVYRIITMSIAILIAFWYNIICYREIRTLLGGVVNRGRG